MFILQQRPFQSINFVFIMYIYIYAYIVETILKYLFVFIIIIIIIILNNFLFMHFESKIYRKKKLNYEIFLNSVYIFFRI